MYVSGWQLSRVLKSIRRKTEQDSEVVICYHEEIPIGVAITHQLRTMTFIRKAHRRKGIGTQLVKALTKVGRVDEGITGSYSFWDQIKLQDMKIEGDRVFCPYDNVWILKSKITVVEQVSKYGDTFVGFVVDAGKEALHYQCIKHDSTKDVIELIK